MLVSSVLTQCRSVFRPRSHYLLLRFCSTGSGRYDQFNILKEKLLANTEGFSPEFVSNVKHDVLGAGKRINGENFDSLFMEACIQNKFYEVGKQFFHYMYEKSDNVGLALIRKFFRLCFYMNEACEEKEKKFIVFLYKKVSKDYPLLDDISCENLSMGLSITEEWAEGMKLLNISKEFGKPTTQLYSSIIVAAFNNGDWTIGWNLLEEMIENELKPNESIYGSILNKSYDSSVVELFHFLDKHGLYLPSETASLLKELKGGNVTTITHKGICRKCNKQLKPIVISDDEFKQMSDNFLNPVLIGKDIFIKTKPSELNAFKQFLSNTSKVDIVLDGLNIAHSSSKKSSSIFTNSKMLMNVVKYFVNKRKRVVVLGRHHMKRWPLSHMAYIKNKASIFFAEDLSSDDLFLLYATMYYGLGTRFVSRDLMRGHKFLLKTPEKIKLFSKWQQKHQMFLTYVENNGLVHFKDVSSYLINPQCNEDSWHIPIIEANQPGVQPHIQALNMKWLCINIGHLPP